MRPRGWTLGAAAGVGLLGFLPSSAWAQAAPRAKANSQAKSQPADPKTAAARESAPKPAPASAPDTAPGAAASDDAAAAVPSSKFLSSQVFRDPASLKLLDVTKFPELRAVNMVSGDVENVEGMAGQPNVQIDPSILNRMIGASLAKLTSHANLQAIVDPPPNLSSSSPVARAIGQATSDLLKPIFTARSARNRAFLVAYDRALLPRIKPLLAGHLISRVQAMIVLGELASVDDMPVFLQEIKNPNQSMWVKLWAFEGISNIVRNGGALNVPVQVDAGKAVADFLDRYEDAPWPVQYRALQALGNMRQGFVPAQPKFAHMASTAMRLLTDQDLRAEVRVEAARALGLMQITTAVPRYNYNLVATAIGELAIDLGSEVASVFGSNKVKSQYLTVLLAGPLDQAFTGDSSLFRESGLLRATTGDAAASIQKVHQLIRPVIKGSADLLSSPSKQVPDRIKDLNARVAALKEHLQKNPPPDRRLVQGGPEYPSAGSSRSAEPAADLTPASRGTTAKR